MSSRGLLTTVALLACGGLASAQSAPDANVYLFDMGREDSALWTGFARVTPGTSYSADRGFGWLNPAADLRGYVANHIDALAIDDVSGTRAVTTQFRIDVPDGEYAVWVLSGAMGNIWRLRYLRAPHDLLLQGQVVQHIAHAEEALFRCANYDWRQGDDIWGCFVQPRFTWLHATAQVSDGKLVVGFRYGHDFPVNAVVVARSDVTNRVAAELGRIDGQRRDAFYALWHEQRPDPDPPCTVSPAERQRGYVAAEVHCSDDVHPWSQPAVDASRERMELLATPGEQEQASLAVYALRDLEGVTFSVSELRADDGKRLASDALQPGLVQFGPWKAGKGQQYRLRECLILPLRPTSVGAGTCKRFWLTFRPPADAAPGVYEGAISISALNAPPASVRLRIWVVPLRLVTPPAERFMYFGTMYYYGRAYLPAFDADRYWASLRAEVRFIKDNEFCRAECILLGGGRKWGKMEGGTVTDVDLSDTEKLMQLLREEDAWPRDNTMICRTGAMNRPLGGAFWSTANPTVTFIPTPEGRENFIRAVKIIDRKAKQAGWPEIAFEMLGEFSNFREAGARFAVEVHTALKEAGVSNTLRGNGPYDMVAIHKNLVDYPQPNWAMMKKEWFDYMKKNSKRLWAYNFARSRFAMGWFCFKHGITRASYESGVYANGQPGNQFDIDTMFPMGLPTSMTTIEPTVWLKRLVQGAVDYEYLWTLDQRIREAQASAQPAAREAAGTAREWLDAKLAELPDSVDYVVGDPRIDHDVQGRFWPVHDLDRFRWQMAQHIMTLDQATGRAAK